MLRYQEPKYSMQSRLDRLSPDLQQVFKTFDEKLKTRIAEVYPQHAHRLWGQTHQVGVSIFCAENKAFVMTTFNKDSIRLNIYTGNSEIEGLEKTTWLQKDDRKGGYFSLYAWADMDLAVEYAVKAFAIAMREAGK